MASRGRERGREKEGDRGVCRSRFRERHPSRVAYVKDGDRVEIVIPRVGNRWRESARNDIPEDNSTRRDAERRRFSLPRVVAFDRFAHKPGHESVALCTCVSAFWGKKTATEFFAFFTDTRSPVRFCGKKTLLRSTGIKCVVISRR